MKYIFLAVLLIVTLQAGSSSPKEFGFGIKYAAIKDVKVRKKVFMEVLHPLVTHAQEKILKEREFVKLYFSIQNFMPIPAALQNRMNRIDKKYKMPKIKSLTNYLKRVDIIHEPLVLAQAAVESAWGTSRFTKLANNIFGEWTWGKKGIIPAGRPEGKKYKIRIFDSLQASVDSYMLNLNRHHSYASFRQARYEKRRIGKCFQGREATNYLQAYSGIGDEYAKMLKGVINYNKMCEYSLLKEAVQAGKESSREP